MRRHVGDHRQGRLVRLVNREFAALAGGGTFATAVAMTYDAGRGKLLVSNAGHPPPLLYRASIGEWEYLAHSPAPAVSSVADRDTEAGPNGTPDGMPPREGWADLPLGIEAPVDYRETQTLIGVGDVVLCYTDWLTESSDAGGQMLGQQGLLALVRALDGSDPSRLVPALLAAVGQRAGAPPTHDDVTVLLLRVTGSYRRRTLFTFAAPFRLVRAVVGSYFPLAPTPAGTA